jgi:hypothetical protein
MKIDKNNNLQLLDNVAKPAASQKTKETQTETQKASGTTTDKVELSSWKQEVGGLTEKAKSISDIREDKVARAQELLKTDPSQIYNGKGEMVARRLLQDHILNEIL